MGKSFVRLYPIDIDLMTWESVPELGIGVEQKVLAVDHASGSVTRLLCVAANTTVPPYTLDRWEETYVLGGSYKCGEEFIPNGSYLCRAPGVVEGPIYSREGYTCFQVRELPRPALDKQPVRLYPIDINRLPWRHVNGQSAIDEKVLTSGRSGSATRMVRIAPGSSMEASSGHQHYEEVLVLRGSLREGQEFHPEGTYTCYPPLTPEGPVLVDDEVICLEVRDYV